MKHLIFATATCLVYSLCAQGADEATDAKLRQAIAPIIKTLPAQIDRRTELTSLMLAPGHIVSYRYALDTNGLLADAASQANMTQEQLRQNLMRKYGSSANWTDAWTKAMAAQMVPLFVNQNCSQPAMQAILKQGYSINHVVNDADGTYIFEHTVTRSECGF